MQLPHPAIFQLHAIVSRIMGMKAAAGFPVLLDDDWDVDSQDGVVSVTQDSDENDWFLDEHRISRPAATVSKTHNIAPKPLNFEICHNIHTEIRTASSCTHSTSYNRSPNHRSVGNQEYEHEKSRLVDAVKAEYPLRMAEMHAKMTERLGRTVGGDRWWAGDTRDVGLGWGV